MTISQSPSKITLSKPSSEESSMAQMVAKASISTTEDMSWMFCEADAITNPLMSRQMTPIPALSSSWNVTASKFALYQPSGGGDHLAPNLTEDLVLIVRYWAALYSINASYALCAIRYKGKPGGVVLTLFLLNQTVQTCIAIVPQCTPN